MPYEVTATRKRPQSFDQLAGQEFVSATLESSLASGRIAHAYLFSGPRGCGKTSPARILAKALNCENGPTAHPCGVCDSCKAITAGSSFDVIEIDGASNTSVDNVRQIKDEVLFPPNGGRYKIYIIDEVHMLSTSAFNALLKTIEEPPPYIVFMFATTELYKVPATIKSRCQQFAFRLVPPETVKVLLASAAAEAGIEAEDEALLWIARESGGSVRDAYTLFDQVVSFAEGKITAALIRDKLGLVGQDRMNSLFGHFIASDSALALSLLDEILDKGVSAEQFLNDAAEFCRGLLFLKHGIAREGLLGAPVSSFDPSLAEALSTERIEYALSVILETYRNLRFSVEPRFELELAVAKLAHIRDYVAPSEVVKAVVALRRAAERGTARRDTAGDVPQTPMASKAPSKAPIDASPAGSGRAAGTVQSPEPFPEPVSGPVSESMPAPDGPELAISDPETLKQAVSADFRRVNGMIATSLSKSGPWLIEGDKLRIHVQSGMEVTLLKQFIGLIAEHVMERAGHPLKIDIVHGAPLNVPAAVATAVETPDNPRLSGLGETGRADRALSAKTAQDAAGTYGARSTATAASVARDVKVPTGGTSAGTALGAEDESKVSLVERLFRGSRVSVGTPVAPSIPVTPAIPVGMAEDSTGNPADEFSDSPSPDAAVDTEYDNPF